MSPVLSVSSVSHECSVLIFSLSLYQENIRVKFNKLMSSLSGITEQRVVFDEEKLSVTKKWDEKLSSKRSGPSPGRNLASEGKQKSPLLSAEFYRYIYE